MEKVGENNRIVRSWNAIRPWAMIAAILLMLHYTGALSQLRSMAGSAVMASGAMDASGDHTEAVSKTFDYNFKLRDLSGKTIDMNELKGRTIFLNIWATWCGPCRMEMPSIQQLYNEVDKSKIVFIMLSVDKDNHDSKVSQYIQSEQYTFPVYRPVDGDLPEQIRVPSIPTTFIISPEGKIASKNVGAANYHNDGFKKYLEALSKGKN